MNNYDLSNPTHRDKLSFEIINRVDDFCQNKYDDGPRGHLGASLIGDPCMRKLWYVFRWVKHTRHTGRMYRLFNRGHREEERFVEWLKGTGIAVSEFMEPDNSTPVGFGKYKDLSFDQISVSDPNYAEWVKDKLKGQQHRISAVGGHFGGSLDGIGTLPSGEQVLLEFKTHNNKSFKELVNHGVKVKKPLHFAQMSMYGKHYRLKYAIYMAIDKNTDDLHIEVVELDWASATELERKAEFIISSHEAPPRLHNNDSHFECKYCDYRLLCFDFDKTLDHNCRSCSHCWPVDNAEWYCDIYQCNVPKEHIKDGCENWEPIC